MLRHQSVFDSVDFKETFTALKSGCVTPSFSVLPISNQLQALRVITFRSDLFFLHSVYPMCLKREIHSVFTAQLCIHFKIIVLFSRIY